MWAEPAILDASVEIASEAPETAWLSRAKKVALTGGAQFLLLLMRPALASAFDERVRILFDRA